MPKFMDSQQSTFNTQYGGLKRNQSKQTSHMLQCDDSKFDLNSFNLTSYKNQDCTFFDSRL